MKTSVFELAYAVLKKQAVSIEYTTPYTSKQVVFGVLIHLDVKAEKCRLMFYDVTTLRPIFDDFKAPQTLTLQFDHIHKLTRFSQYTYAPNTELVETVTDYLKNEGKALPWMALLDADLEGDYRSLRYHPLRSDDVNDRQPYETLYTLRKADQDRPLIVWRLAYNLETQTFEKVSKEWLINGVIDDYFKALPLVDLEVIDEHLLGDYLKEGVTIVKEAKTFTLKIRDRKLEKERIKQFIEAPFNRPMRGYLNQLSLRNLGRKKYRLPHFETQLLFKENLAAYTSLKHPITLIDIDRTTNARRLFTQLINTSLLNQQSVLIVDPHQRLPSPLHLRVFDVRSKEYLMESLRRLNSLKKAEDSSLSPMISVDYDELYTRYQDDEEMFEHSMAMQGYHNVFARLDDFHASVSYATHLTALHEHPSSVQLSSFKQAMATEKDVENTLNEIELKTVERLKQPSHQKINEVLTTDDAEKRYNKVSRIMRNEHIFNQLKTLFNVIVVRDTKRLPYRLNAFDRLILIEPSQKQLPDLLYADKLTIIDQSVRRYYQPYQGERFLPIAYVHAKYQDQPYHVFNCLSSNLVKRHSFRKTGLAYHTFTNVINHHQYMKHLAKDEAQHVLNQWRDYKHDSTQIITPFNRQRRYLKNAIKTQPKPLITTFYSALQRPYVLLSLTVHKAMAKETYDWLKNHPQLETLMRGLDQVNLNLFGDFKAMIHHATEEDAWFELVVSMAFNPYLEIDTTDTFIERFKEYLAKGYHFKSCHRSSLETLRLPKEIRFIESYRVVELDQTFVIVELPLTMPRNHLKRLEERLRQDNYILITQLPSRQGRMENWRRFMHAMGLV